MVEIVVMLAILVAISVIILTGFPGFNEQGALFRAAQEIALSLRHAQNIAFAVAEVSLENGSRVTPFRIGIHFDLAAPSEYFLFVDQNQDNIYTSGTDGVIQGSRVAIPRGVTVTELKNESNQTHSEANVVFTAPEAETVITNASMSIGALLQVKITAPNSSLSKTIGIRTSGQVSIQ